jgi:hypothetical protein
MEAHLATLARQEASVRAQEAEDIEQLRQAWSPALIQAKTILAELSALEAAYMPTLEALGRRDFAILPPTAQTLNAVAPIERTCQELRHHFGHTMEDLRRVITAVEGLSPRTVALLHANRTTSRELLAFYRHAPRGVEEKFQRLERTVAPLTAGVESASSEEVYTLLPRLPSPAAPTIEVEMG